MRHPSKAGDFCSRTGSAIKYPGATIKGKFYELTVTGFLAHQIRRKEEKMARKAGNKLSRLRGL